MTSFHLLSPEKAAACAALAALAGAAGWTWREQGSLRRLQAGPAAADWAGAAYVPAALPELPAMAEFLPGFEAVAWYGYVGPAGLPKPLVTRWNEVLKVSLQDPETLKRLAAVGVDPLYSTPEEFAAYIKAEVPKWAQVVKASGAKAD